MSGILAAATGARVLHAVQPELAARLLSAAREDHAAIIGDFAAPPAEAPALNINQPSGRDLVSYLTLATVELFRASGQATYRADAVHLGRHVDCRLGSTASAPFNVLPAAVWRLADLDAALPEDRTGSMLAAHASPLFPTPPSAQQTRRRGATTPCSRIRKCGSSRAVGLL